LLSFAWKVSNDFISKRVTTVSNNKIIFLVALNSCEMYNFRIKVGNVQIVYCYRSNINELKWRLIPIRSIYVNFSLFSFMIPGTETVVSLSCLRLIWFNSNKWSSGFRLYYTSNSTEWPMIQLVSGFTMLVISLSNLVKCDKKGLFVIDNDFYNSIDNNEKQQVKDVKNQRIII
jgi:hypothetical protein